MFAVVRTGGKQYRVAAGDKIVVDRMDGEAGARVTLGDVLFTSTGESGISVAAEVVAQAKADKVIVFKKKRRHNYRRKNGHRQQHTILKILSVGAVQAEEKKAKAAKPAKAEAAPVEAEAVAPVAVETTPVEAAAVEAPTTSKKPRAKKADAAPQE
jgi:large subunit ribosomal protein L21